MERSTAVVGREATVGCVSGNSAAVGGLAGLAPDIEAIVLRPVREEVGEAEVEFSEKRCLTRLTRISRGRVTESGGEHTVAVWQRTAKQGRLWIP